MKEIFRMSDIFMFQLPRKIIFGNGAIKKIGEEAASMFPDKKNILTITDKGVMQAGMAYEAINSLKKIGFEVKIFDEVVPDPPISLVLKGVEIARKAGAQIILGIGGGSTIDTAKAVSVLVPYAGDIYECLGINRVKSPGLSKIFVPTTAGTGSELSHTFVLTDDQSGDKITSYSSYAFSDISIIDPELTLSLPPRITAESGMDAFSHALESYVTIKANPLSDLLSLRGIQVISGNIRQAYAKGSHNLEARYAMCFGVCLGTMAIRSSGLGAIHALSYPPAMKYKLSHGLAIAIMMPFVMEYNLISNPEKFGAVALAMGEREEKSSIMDKAKASLKGVKQLIADLNLPPRLRDVGARKEDFPEFAKVDLKRYGHHLANNPRNLAEEDIIKIYESAW